MSCTCCDGVCVNCHMGVCGVYMHADDGTLLSTLWCSVCSHFREEKGCYVCSSYYAS